MTRSHMGALLALLTVALSTRPAAAQPTPAPAPPPAAAPAPTPAATAPAGPSQRWSTGRGPEGFVAGDYMWGTFSKNQFNTLGENDRQSFAGRAAIAWPFGKVNVMAEGTYDHFQYLHQTAPVALIGGGQALVPSFFIHQTDWDGRAGIGLPYPRVFLVASYGQRRNNFNYPNLQGLGFGIEKLPDFNEKTASFFGSYLWYPQFGAGKLVQYGLYKYSFGLEFHVPNGAHIPVFLEFGVLGDYAYAKKNAPTYLSDSGVLAGVGLYF